MARLVEAIDIGIIKSPLICVFDTSGVFGVGNKFKAMRHKGWGGDRKPGIVYKLIKPSGDVYSSKLFSIEELRGEVSLEYFSLSSEESFVAFVPESTLSEEELFHYKLSGGDVDTISIDNG